MSVGKVLHTAKVHTTGGREGTGRSADGHLNIQLSNPGPSRNGTNPEELFAVGWSACFLSAMGIAASKSNINLPASRAIDAEVDLLNFDGDYFIQARLNVKLPGMDHDVALALIHEADQICPYSKAIRGDIDVVINLI